MRRSLKTKNYTLQDVHIELGVRATGGLDARTLREGPKMVHERVPICERFVPSGAAVNGAREGHLLQAHELEEQGHKIDIAYRVTKQ